jgi:hypothetical protein
VPRTGIREGTSQCSVVHKQRSRSPTSSLTPPRPAATSQSPPSPTISLFSVGCAGQVGGDAADRRPWALPRGSVRRRHASDARTTLRGPNCDMIAKNAAHKNFDVVACKVAALDPYSRPAAHVLRCITTCEHRQNLVMADDDDVAAGCKGGGAGAGSGVGHSLLRHLHEARLLASGALHTHAERAVNQAGLGLTKYALASRRASRPECVGTAKPLICATEPNLSLHLCPRNRAAWR